MGLYIWLKWSFFTYFNISIFFNVNKLNLCELIAVNFFYFVFV